MCIIESDYRKTSDQLNLGKLLLNERRVVCFSSRGLGLRVKSIRGLEWIGFEEDGGWLRWGEWGQCWGGGGGRGVTEGCQTFKIKNRPSDDEIVFKNSQSHTSRLFKCKALRQRLTLQCLPVATCLFIYPVLRTKSQKGQTKNCSRKKFHKKTTGLIQMI